MESKEKLYKNYIDLINVCYFPNKEELDHDRLRIIIIQLQMLLDREYSSNITFIAQNNTDHYKIMHTVIDTLALWSRDASLYGYASEEEFYKTMNIFRRQFDKYTIDVIKSVGKYPKESRERFSRGDIHAGTRSN